MLNKVVLGTANFNKAYGILSQGEYVDPREVSRILKEAFANNIRYFDTAFNYGNFQAHLDTLDGVSEIKLINKFSVMDNYDFLYQKVKLMCEKNNLECLYGFLVHDPGNIQRVNLDHLQNFLYRIRDEGLTHKIGVSVYDLQELKAYARVLPTELVQIPLHPLNQLFLHDIAKEYIKSLNAEIHGRSLFLQGVLLSESLPLELDNLREEWNIFSNLSMKFSSKLGSLLSWANKQEIVDKWVLGVSSLQDMKELIQFASRKLPSQPADCFNVLKHYNNLYADPRQWNK